MTTTLTHKTFEQWKKDNPELAEVETDCLECGGDGNHMCTCGDTHPCGECDGTGKTKEGVSLEVQYRKQYRLDKMRLEIWTGNP
jgi:DnaJ-class molecular chaperone